MPKARANLTLDLADHPQLLEMLRLLAVTQKTTQKQVVIEALEAYFAQKQENHALLAAANRTFAEWNNPEDAVYDNL